MDISQYAIKAEIGMIYLIASERGLLQVSWKLDPKVPLISNLRSSAQSVKILAEAARQLKEYFRGERQRFELPFDIGGTSFQKRVWKGLTKISYGDQISYKELAVRVGHAKAFRAVGSANGKNPLFIVIPCHRVIAANGSLGGYSGPMHIKKYLLNLEQQHRR